MGANTEEARAAYTRREFECKNSLVLREARESRFWLRLIVATRLASLEQIEPLLAEANELVGIYTATVKKGKASEILSFKFRDEMQATLGLLAPAPAA